MAEINPFSLINNPRLTPSLPDHSAVQKLLTDAHIQQSKNKAAAARNRATVQGSVVNRMLQDNIPISQQAAAGVGVPSLSGNVIRDLMATRSDLANEAAAAGAFKDHTAGLLSSKKANINPTRQVGTPAQIAGGPFTVAPGLAVQPSVVTTHTNEVSGYGDPNNPMGVTKFKKGQQTKQKGATSTVGPKADAEQLFKAGRQDQLRHGMELSAKHLNISVQQLVDMVVKGLQDGSVTFFRDPAKNGSGVIINGQRHFWK